MQEITRKRRVSAEVVVGGGNLPSPFVFVSNDLGFYGVMRISSRGVAIATESIGTHGIDSDPANSSTCHFINKCLLEDHLNQSGLFDELFEVRQIVAVL